MTITRQVAKTPGYGPFLIAQAAVLVNIIRLGTCSVSLSKWKADQPKNSVQDYEGVTLKTFLAKVGVKSNAKEMVLTAGDGFSATVALADVAACDLCGIAIQDGTLGGVFPAQASKAWVEDILTGHTLVGEIDVEILPAVIGGHETPALFRSSEFGPGE